MIYIVLAAGAARRMGFAKVFTPLRGSAPLERIAEVLRGRDTIVVVPPERREQATALAPEMRVVTNGEAARGMAHSLRLALECVDRDESVGVVLGDKPFLRRETVEQLERALADADVVYPVDVEGVPGHPVLFSARARPLLDALPDGDTISQVRDAPSLRSRALETADAGAFTDLNDPAAWEAADA